jgi:hypothetical protein
MNFEVSTPKDRSTAAKVNDYWIEMLINHNIIGLEVSMQN